MSNKTADKRSFIQKYGDWVVYLSLFPLGFAVVGFVEHLRNNDPETLIETAVADADFDALYSLATEKTNWDRDDRVSAIRSLFVLVRDDEALGDRLTDDDLANFRSLLHPNRFEPNFRSFMIERSQNVVEHTARVSLMLAEPLIRTAQASDYMVDSPPAFGGIAFAMHVWRDGDEVWLSPEAEKIDRRLIGRFTGVTGFDYLTRTEIDRVLSQTSRFALVVHTLVPEFLVTSVENFKNSNTVPRFLACGSAYRHNAIVYVVNRSLSEIEWMSKTLFGPRPPEQHSRRAFSSEGSESSSGCSYSGGPSSELVEMMNVLESALADSGTISDVG